jgi:hypothetical protein
VIRATVVALALLVASAAGARAQSQTPKAAPKPAPATAGAQKPSEQQTKALNLSAYAELLRSDVRTQKIAIITEVMGFTDKEDAAFWPIYREYDLEMSKLGDERIAMTEEYARHYSQLSDDMAAKLATKAIDLSTKRDAALAKCYERVKTALSAKTALRFLQVEHQLLLLIDLQIASSLPIAQ